MKRDDDNLLYCDFAKMMLMLCVMLNHCCAFWTGRWFSVVEPLQQSSFIGHVSEWLGTFHIPAFVLISGYIYSYIKREKLGYRDLKSFIKKKAQRLLLPYLTITIFWLIPFSFIFRDYSVKDYVLKYFLYGGEQLWFLYMLFFVFIVFYILEPFLIRHKHLSWLIIVTLYVIGWLLDGYKYFQVSASFQYLLFFWLGYNMRIYEPYIFHNCKLSLNHWYVLLSLFLISLLLFKLYNSPYLYSHSRAILCIIMRINGAVTAFAIFIKLGRYVNLNRPFVKALITNNYSMYLFHQQIIYVSIYVFNGIVCPEIHSIINFCLSFSISFLISFLLNKSKTVRFLLGMK